MYMTLPCQTPPGYNAEIRSATTPKAIHQTYSTAWVEYLSVDKLGKYQSLLENFDLERNLFPALTTELPSAEARVKRRINTISTWDFSKASLEITEDRNAVFKLLLTEGKTLYVGLNLNEEPENDSYFAYYEYDTCKRNGVGSFIDIIADLTNLEIL